MLNQTNKQRIQYAIIALLCAAIVLCAVLIPLYFTGIIGREPGEGRDLPQKEELPKDFEFISVSAKSAPKGQYAQLTVEYLSKEYQIEVYLLSNYAPKTVENFVKYANDGLYNDTVFYGAGITYYEDSGKPSSAIIQGGGYTVDSDGNLVKKTTKEYYGKVKGEFLANDPQTKNNVSFTAGILGMVREEDDYDSADTEFFILSYAHAQYNGYYAAFGVIIDSDDVTDVYSFTKAVKESSGSYPVKLKKVKIYKNE